MDWEEEQNGHEDDQDNQRQSHAFSSDLPSGTPLDWDVTALDTVENSGGKRLDYLLPLDPETGVTTHQAVCTYIDAMIEMVSRHNQALSILSIAVDESVIMKFLGKEGAALIGRAVARCLRQETRTHDVVGHADPEISPDAFTFLVTCPLLNEEQAANLGERLRAAMTATSGNPEYPWLTLSVGVAALSLEVTESPMLIARSMEALRRARRKGGSRVWKHTDTRRAIIENSEKENDEQSEDADRREDWNEDSGV